MNCIEIMRKDLFNQLGMLRGYLSQDYDPQLADYIALLTRQASERADFISLQSLQQPPQQPVKNNISTLDPSREKRLRRHG